MTDHDPTRSEIETWLRETTAHLETLHRQRRRYLQLDPDRRAEFARHHGFVNLTDLNQSITHTRQRRDRYQRLLDTP